MSFLTPLALIGGLLAIPIIMLYMLRLRRREVLISSTYLWQQVLADNEANTPWQRLRRNLLLLLQLLILAALVIALARPFVTVPAVGAGQIILLLDASASMNATDTEAGTRLDAARQEALNVVGTMSATDTMTVIRVAETPQVIAPATSDRLALTTAIMGTQPSQASADWVGALTLALGSTGGSADSSLVIISDGNLGDLSLLPEIPGEINYIPVGSAGDNVAISALATRALPGQNPQLFAQIANYGDQPADVVFSLSLDGTLFRSEFYTIPARSELAVTEQIGQPFSIIEASVAMRSGSLVPDYLPDDNTAWTVSGGVITRRALLMTQGNLFVQQVLRSLPGIEAFQGDPARGLPTQPFDLYILDGWLPGTLPPGDLLIINPPRSTTLFSVGDESRNTTSLRVDASDPRMTYVDFASVNLLAYRQVTHTGWADELISAPDGPLLLVGEIDGRQVAVLTFDVHNSDLPLQITWPILMANLMEWFAPQGVLTTTSSLSVGDSLVIRPPLSAETLRIEQPDGTRREIAIDRQSIIYADTGQVGVYRLDVLEGESVQQSQFFTVNLFDPTESRIMPQPSIRLGQATISPAVSEDVGQMELWPLVALLGLLILLIEWYVYHQRLQAPTILRPRRA
jgi:Ca-activated chloride channel family protein